MSISQNDTKHRILHEALRLFSLKGYDGVTVSDIAESVGIKAPSLYKHYRSKKEIFQSIIDEAESRFREFIDSIKLPEDLSSAVITPDVLAGKLRSFASYSLHDEEFSMLRRLLMIEQFRDSDIASLYSSFLVDSMYDYHTALFRRLMDAGMIRDEDPRTLAVMYGSPVMVMIEECERHPEKEEESMRILSEHASLFYRTFSVKEDI